MEEAVVWLVRLGHATPEERAAFAVWRADPANDVAFARAEALWRATGEGAARLAARGGAPPSPRWAAPAAAQRRPRMRASRLAAACAAALLLVGGAWLERPALIQDTLADVVTARAERRSLVLPDGSTLELEADSAVDLAFGPDERRVSLLRGAAWFSVVPEARPFIVAAAAGEVQVLGTRFALRHAGEEAVLAVASGRVELRAPGARSAILGRGEQMRFGPRGAGAVAPIAPEDVAPWRDGRLIFEQARFAEVIEALGRHRPGRIVIASAELADRRVSANLPASDPAAALASLQSILGFRRQDFTSHLVVLR
nr:FecR domain-containing protein [Roseococcus sp. SDR]